MVLYRDMRTYGFREAAYREAREKGVLFVRYEPEQPPQLEVNGRLQLRVREPALGRDLELTPDLVILAAPMIPRADRQELSELLRVPLNADGFFLEAHMKLRPVDFASEGLFLCGTAHAPKFLSETIAQANAVAGRAASILSRGRPLDRLVNLSDFLDVPLSHFVAAGGSSDGDSAFFSLLKKFEGHLDAGLRQLERVGSILPRPDRCAGACSTAVSEQPGARPARHLTRRPVPNPTVVP